MTTTPTVLSASQRRAADRAALNGADPVARLEAALANIATRQAEITPLIDEAALRALENPTNATMQAELASLEEEERALKAKESRTHAALAAAKRRVSDEGRAAERAARQADAARARNLAAQYAKAAARFDEHLAAVVDALAEMNDTGRQIARAAWDAGVKHDERLMFNLHAPATVFAARCHEGRVAPMLAPLIDIGGRAGVPDLADLVARSRERLDAALNFALQED